ncbi:MAG TPA: xanthine dehydrogenase accessory protein XdhC [Rhizobiales bacterium]|nr:xanthine dehydrogenase accessory protein XdhC [Hyphomicrobiales bacterium]
MDHGNHAINRFFNDHRDVAEVVVNEAKGSTPRDAGTWMLVAPDAIFGTIGGGYIEHLAIARARQMLAGGGDGDMEFSVPLGSASGQCCGGNVTLTLCRLDDPARARIAAKVEGELAARPAVHVFGAGHVGMCLIKALCLLPVRPVLVDSRKELLQAAPPGVETCLAALPELIVRRAPPASAFVILTHKHSLDFLIAKEVLQRNDARYAGMIGSKTKRAVFARWFKQENGSPEQLSGLVCPIGGKITGDKRPQVIASFVAAEIMERLACPAQNADLRNETGGMEQMREEA